jgi:uncharacterized SAM-binding protein YcdF (DUF218 family)
VISVSPALPPRRLRRLFGAAWRVGRACLALAGAVTLLGLLWLALGLPLFIDAALNVTTPPGPVDAIVCIGGGTVTHDIPTDDGWRRIHTAVQLHADGFAPIVVFTGRGNARVSEAEIYAEAAEWLGLPREAVRLDPLPASTAEHPATLLKSLDGRLTRDSRILLVTSNLHSRRVRMTFQRAGFDNVRVVSHYLAVDGPRADGRKQVSELPGFAPDSKRYDDTLFVLSHRSSALFMALREWVAIAVYRWRGQV